MTRALPPLNALKAFEATVRHGSLTRAADELSVTQGAISRHVSQLEAWLDVELLVRLRRGVEATPQGAAYARAVRDAFDQIETGTRRVMAKPNENRLRIKLPPTFAIRWFVPRLARFHARHREIDVQITTSHQSVDFNRDEVDLCIHSGAEPPRGAVLRRLFGETLTPVASPGLLAAGGGLREPADLSRHVLLCSMHRPNDWPVWLRAARVAELDGNAGLKFENSALAYQAAIDELGVVMAQRAFVEEDLRSGRLVAPLDLQVETAGGYYLAYSEARARSPAIRAFEQWILQEAAAVQPS